MKIKLTNLSILLNKKGIITFVFVFILSNIIAQKEKYIFDYSDIKNFKEAYLSIQSGADPIKEIDNYFEKGSPGLKSWLDIYGVSSKKLAEQIVKRPQFYKSFLNIDKTLKGFEDEISNGYSKLLELYPDPNEPILPTYYFVLWSGGGSVRPNGSMISVDYFGLSKNIDLSEFPEGLFPKGKIPLVPIDNVPHVAVHEMVHWFQRKFQGLDNYVSIYRNKERSTLLAYAIREGGADMLTRFSSGIEDEARNNFGRKHEKEIWEAFKPNMYKNIDSVKGWFSGSFEDNRQWPFQIGYYIGMEITQYYYDQAEDKKAAILEIFSANTPEQFIKFVEVYEKKFLD